MTTKNKLPEQLEQAFRLYETLQQRHIASIREKRPDFNVLFFQRQQAFEALKNNLNDLRRRRIGSGNGHKSQGIIALCRSKLTTIVKTDRTLIRMIGEYRQQLGERLKKMRHGKKALSGYSGYPLKGSVKKPPKFVSKKG